MYNNSRVVIVAAIGNNRELGNGNKLLWNIPEDLKRFRDFTRGHPVILGRKTFESILSILRQPLPNRTNIVVTRDPAKIPIWDNVRAVKTLDDALRIATECEGGEEIHIGGGAEMYTLSLPHVDTLHLTHVNDSPKADTFFPSYKELFEPHEGSTPQIYGDLTYVYQTYKKRRSE